MNPYTKALLATGTAGMVRGMAEERKEQRRYRRESATQDRQRQLGLIDATIRQSIKANDPAYQADLELKDIQIAERKAQLEAQPELERIRKEREGLRSQEEKNALNEKIRQINAAKKELEEKEKLLKRQDSEYRKLREKDKEALLDRSVNTKTMIELMEDYVRDKNENEEDARWALSRLTTLVQKHPYLKETEEFKQSVVPFLDDSHPWKRMANTAQEAKSMNKVAPAPSAAGPLGFSLNEDPSALQAGTARVDPFTPPPAGSGATPEEPVSSPMSSPSAAPVDLEQIKTNPAAMRKVQAVMQQWSVDETVAIEALNIAKQGRIPIGEAVRRAKQRLQQPAPSTGRDLGSYPAL